MIAVVGPTGIGKGEVAVALARWIPAEIVVVDSMQVYRGMDLGTGKLDPSIRSGIPHHGLDLVDPEEEFHVARYIQGMAPTVQAIQKRGCTPLLVGGSGLYMKALLDGLCPAPGKDPMLREQLFEEGRQKGPEALYARLQRVDSMSATRIHPNDLRRVVRALEVFLVSGKPLSVWHRQTIPSVEKDDIFLIGLTCSRDLLYRRIENRVDRWVASRWLKEAERLHRRTLSMTAREALGYRELFDYLEGRTDLENAIRLIKRNTRRYAKRQLAWFRSETRIQWIDVGNRTPETVAQLIMQDVITGSDDGVTSPPYGTRPTRQRPLL